MRELIQAQFFVFEGFNNCSKWLSHNNNITIIYSMTIIIIYNLSIAY